VREQLARAQHSARAERNELEDAYRKLRSADQEELRVLRARLAAYESGAGREDAAGRKASPQPRAKRKTPDLVNRQC